MQVSPGGLIQALDACFLLKKLLAVVSVIESVPLAVTLALTYSKRMIIMSSRLIEHEIFAEGIRQFAERTRATFNRPDELMYELKYPDDEYQALVGIEHLGMTMSYAIICDVVPNQSLAPNLLQKNWGGVEGSCFYFSVHVENGTPFLVLETRQFLDPDTTSEDIASILSWWWIQWRQAKKALE